MASNVGEIENGTVERDYSAMFFTVPIDMEKPSRPRSAPPKRLLNYTKKTLIKEELDHKQQEADQRRKEHERKMLARVQQSREDVMRLNKNFSALLEQDAKRQGCHGTNDIPYMSRQQLRDKFQAVNRDYNKIAIPMINSKAHMSKQ